MNTVLIAIYCPRCDYWMKLAVPEYGVGTHGCMQCGGGMEVFIAQGSREAVAWHGAVPEPEPQQGALMHTYPNGTEVWMTAEQGEPDDD